MSSIWVGRRRLLLRWSWDCDVLLPCRGGFGDLLDTLPSFLATIVHNEYFETAVMKFHDCASC